MIYSIVMISLKNYSGITILIVIKNVFTIKQILHVIWPKSIHSKFFKKVHLRLHREVLSQDESLKLKLLWRVTVY